MRKTVREIRGGGLRVGRLWLLAAGRERQREERELGHGPEALDCFFLDRTFFYFMFCISVLSFHFKSVLNYLKNNRGVLANIQNTVRAL